MWGPPLPCPYPVLSKYFVLLLLFNLFRFFLIVITRYRLNTTKYVIKEPKKYQKVPKFNKRTLSTLSDPPTPVGLIHFFKIKNIHIMEFCYPHARPPLPKLGRLQPIYVGLSRLGCSLDGLQDVWPDKFCQA